METAPGRDPRPSVLPALVWTLLAFLLPVLAYTGWVWSATSVNGAGCASGGACPVSRAVAAGKLLAAAPTIGLGLVLALLLTVALRRVIDTWRGITVSFAAVVIGLGLATLITRVAA